MGFPAYYTGYGGAPPPRSGARNAVIAPYGPYTAGDGKVVYLGLQNEREWARFCEEVLGRPDACLRRPLQLELRSAWRHRDAMDALITAAFSTLTAADVIARLESAGIANARMNTVQEFLDASATRGTRPLAYGRVARRPDPRAACRRSTSTGVEIPMGPIPAVGEHTDAILGELGFSAGDGRRVAPRRHRVREPIAAASCSRRTDAAASS